MDLGNDIYYLDTNLLSTTPTSFTDNDIYEMFLLFIQNAVGYTGIETISNRSIASFVIFNVPDNATLNETYDDSDQDGLSDWTELYVTYTSPFLVDTDNDGATDYEEVNGANHGYINSDPNNYTNTTGYRYTPDIKILKPEKALYLNNKKIIPFFTPLIIKGIDIEVSLSNNKTIVERVEFYIDDQLRATDTTYPYSLVWDERTPLKFRHLIKVIAYGNYGNTANDEINVWKFL